MKEKISKKNSQKKVPLPYFCQLLKKKSFSILNVSENKKEVDSRPFDTMKENE
jgi:hypothetical protein